MHHHSDIPRLTGALPLWVALCLSMFAASVVLAGPAAADARPVAANDSITVTANTAFTLDFCANDLPGDGASTIIYVTQPPSGVDRAGCVLSGSTDACNLNTVWYFVRDADGDTDWGQIQILVDCSGIDRVPRPKPDILRNFFRDQPGSFDLCVNDDLGDEPTVVSYSTSLPAGLTRVGCEITGVPTTCASAANFFYWLQDADGDRGYTYATIQVRCTPKPEPDTYSLEQGVFFSANVCVNDYLADEPTTTAYSVALPPGLTLVDCVLAGTPSACANFQSFYWIRDRDSDRSSTTIDSSVACAFVPAASIVHFDDLETEGGWTLNPIGSDSASAGVWERANPERSVAASVYQLDAVPTGLTALVTGASAGAGVGANDLDGGTSTIRSAPIPIPYVTDAVLEFDWYLAHDASATTDDGLTVRVTGPAGDSIVLDVRGSGTDRPAQWRHHAVSIPQFIGASIQVVISATDSAGDGVVEAAIDNVEVRQVPVAPPALAPSVAITSADYKLPAQIYPDVRTDLETELWATVYRPSSLTGGPYPVVMIMHGNHETCGTGGFPRLDNNNSYATTGTCPAGYAPVPSQTGYDWLAEPLAAAGYIVVSINTNRGINGLPGVPSDTGLVKARGRLLLKHLETLHEWSTVGGAPTSLGLGTNGLIGQLDLGQVALVGHSRGGEGVRAAYNTYDASGSSWPAAIPGLDVKAIAEIAPLDQLSSEVINVSGVPWLGILPMCDLDDAGWSGYEVYARAVQNHAEVPPTPKATMAIWGADHGGFNSAWHQNDTERFAGGCVGEQNWQINDPIASTSQQVGPALEGIGALIASYVGPQANLEHTRTLDPMFSLPPSVSLDAPISRTWINTPSTGLLLDDFKTDPGLNLSSGVTTLLTQAPPALGLTSQQSAARLQWFNPGGNTYFQSNWTPAGTGADVSAQQTFEFRIGRADTTVRNAATNFSIRIVAADGSLSQHVELNRYATVWDIAGASRDGSIYDHPIMATVRIPLSDFGALDLTSIRGVRMTFDDGPGAIYVSDFRFTSG